MFSTSDGTVVKRTPAERVVEFLRFSSPGADGLSNHGLSNLSLREWEYVLRWLDDAGLALYFLEKLKNEKLKNIDSSDALPVPVLAQLEQRFAANQQRVGSMADRFCFLNHKFNHAGVRYVVIKGFSLVPQFCPDAGLRYQADLDYLVNEESLSAAQQVLLEAGYSPKASPSSQEFMFVAQGAGEPSRRPGQYDAQSPHSVELHLDIWDSDLHRVPLTAKLFSAERARTRHWNGLEFPALAEEDAFLLQVLHACHHLFSQWIRMSCLFEIGYFLSARASDTSLWNRIEERVGDNLMLREFVVIVAELVARVFASPLPALVGDWGRQIRPAPRVWIESYARPWAFCDLPVYEFRLFPTAKLALFLHRQYMDARVSGRAGQGRIQPPSRLARMASSLSNQPSLALDAAWWRRHLLFRRGLFHALAGLRYLCEIPRWRWLNRASARSGPAGA